MNEKIALQKFEKSLKESNKFDLIIVNSIINGTKKGMSLIYKFRELDPGIKAVLSIRNKNELEISNFEEVEFIRKLEKPYNMKDIKNLLDDLF